MSSRLPPLPRPGALVDPMADGAKDGAADESADLRLTRRRRQRLQMLGMATASYAVDTLLFVALAAAGALPMFVALGYGAAAAACCAAFAVLLGSGWTERCRDHYLAVPQMLAHASLMLVFIAWAPQVGGLLMMLLFIVFGFGSLRMGRRDVTRGAMAIAVMIGALVSVVGDSLAVPLDGPAQRLLSGLWISLILMRTAMLGLYGAQLRELLARRNEELAATFAKLEHLASRDGLTGTLNRRSLMQAIQVELERQQRGGSGFGVVMFDLDHFKQVNDGHGHGVGDEVLRRFAQEAGRVLRASDHLGRYGGEEFLAVLSGAADAASVGAAAERVRSLVAMHEWSALRPGLRVTVSAGVTLCRGQDTPEQLLARADAALYAAKRAGRNRIEFA